MNLPSLRESAASKQRSRLFMVSLGLFGLAMFLLFALIGFTAPNAIPGRSYYTLYAQFTDADNVTPHNEVRVDGDIVGQVLNPRIVHGVGQIELQLAPSVKPLRSDTTVQVVPRSAVGVRYVEVTPGLHGTPLPNGATIRFTRTGATEPLDTALSTLNGPTRANLRRFLRNLGEGLLGQGQNLNHTLQDTPSMENNATAVLGAIAARPGAVASLIDGAATLSSTSQPVRAAIASGFRPQAQALEPFAQSTGSIRSTLTAAPPAFRTAATRLPAFDAFAAQLSGFATAVTPGLRAAPAAFSETTRLLVDARPALMSATGVLRETGRAVNPTLNLLSTVAPVLSPIRTGVLKATPLVSDLGAHGCDIVLFGTHWTSMQKYGTSEGNVLRFDIADGGQADAYGATSPSTPPFHGPYPTPCTDGLEQPK